MFIIVKKYSPDLVYFYTAHVFKGNKVIYSNHTGKIEQLDNTQMFYESFIVGHDNCILPTKCVHNSVIKKCTTDYKDLEKYKNSEDLLQVFEIISNSNLGIRVDKPLYLYHQNDLSITHNLNYELRYQALSISSFIVLSLFNNSFYETINPIKNVTSIFYSLFDVVSVLYSSHVAKVIIFDYYIKIKSLQLFIPENYNLIKPYFYSKKNIKCKVVVWLFMHRLFFVLRFIYCWK